MLLDKKATKYLCGKIVTVNLPRRLMASLVVSSTGAIYQVFLESATDNFGHLCKLSKQLRSLLAASISCFLVGCIEMHLIIQSHLLCR